jgi:xanthine dehydrogenase YagR molybdenum-binding subunit
MAMASSALQSSPQAIPRADARVKVTGQARYPSDIPVANPAFGCLATSAVARGSIRAINLEAARSVPGVLDILTHQNANVLKPSKIFADGGYFGTSIVPLSGPKIWHDGQIVALVVAETFEAASEAAARIAVHYDAAAPSAVIGSEGTTVKAVADVDKLHKDPVLGDAQAAFGAAPVTVDAEYSTPTQHHNPMELFTTTCVWVDDKLTVYEPSQFVYGLKYGIAEQIGIDADDVHVVSPFVGGAFGSKGSLTQRTALVALAARRLQRPVKLAATRAQGFTIATYRAETRHHVRLGADRQGKILAYLHEAWELTSRPDNYNVSGTTSTAVMYDYGSVATKVNVVNADRNTPGFMRLPPEVPYMYALEAAMDELAVALKMDPIELRRVNDTMKDPVSGRPYSSCSLIECIEQGAEAFGWRNRSAEPGSMRDGDWLVGWGYATACYPTQISPAAARVRLTPDGSVRVSIAAHEIGNGAYTVIGQAAAERLGLSPDRVTVYLGDSALPAGPVAGGSNTTASTTTVVVKACDAIRDKTVPRSMSPNDMNKLYHGHAAMTGGPKGEKLAFAFGAQFVEVRVHALTGEIRAPRAVGAFAAGRIMNPRTARSQLMGGIIWGLSAALHEATEIDERTARYVNTNLADYLIPVNADIQSVEVLFVPETDDWINPLGVKGLGELGNVGVNAAVANAIFHATGKRVRDLPIRLETLLT